MATNNRVSPGEEIQSASGGASNGTSRADPGNGPTQDKEGGGLGDTPGQMDGSFNNGAGSLENGKGLKLHVKTKWDIGSEVRGSHGNAEEVTDKVGMKKRTQNIGAVEEDDTSNISLFIAPGIFHPYSLTRLSWDIWIAVLLVYTALMVPYSLAFSSAICTTDVDIFAEVSSWLVDICFWLDIILNFRTAIVDPKSQNQSYSDLITDWRAIARAYVRGWFILDVAGSIPVSLLEIAVSGDSGGCAFGSLKALRLNKLARLAKLLKLLRLVRLARWNRIINKAKDSLSINPGFIRLFQGMLVVCVIAHVLACLVYAMVEWQEWGGLKDSWANHVTITVPGEAEYVLNCPDPALDELVEGQLPGGGLPIARFGTLAIGKENVAVVECIIPGGDPDRPIYHPEAPPAIKYLSSLYLAFTTITTVGYGDITMVTTPELIYAIIMMALGATTFAVMVGQIAALLSKLDIRATAFKERMEDLDDFMHQENLPLDLRFRTRAFFEYGFFNARDIPATVHELSASLRTEVALHLYNDLITTVPFFRDCGKEFLTEIILRLKAQTLSPGDYLYEEGEYGDSMYFLIKGSVEVEVDAKHGVFAELREGSYLGETCVLGLSEVRPVSVRAMNWCNLFCLTMDALEDCLAHHPEAQVHFRKLAVQTTAEKTVQGAIERLEQAEQEAGGGGESPPKAPSPTKSPGGLRVGGAGSPAPDARKGKLSGVSFRTDGGEGEEDEAREPPVVTRALRRTKKILTPQNSLAASASKDRMGGGDGGEGDGEEAGQAAAALKSYLVQVAKSKHKGQRRKVELREGIDALERRLAGMIDQASALKLQLQPVAGK